MLRAQLPRGACAGWWGSLGSAVELGGERPALPGHDTAPQKVSLAILFIYSSLLLHFSDTSLTVQCRVFLVFHQQNLSLVRETNGIQTRAKLSPSFKCHQKTITQPISRVISRLFYLTKTRGLVLKISLSRCPGCLRATWPWCIPGLCRASVPAAPGSSCSRMLWMLQFSPGLILAGTCQRG